MKAPMSDLNDLFLDMAETLAPREYPADATRRRERAISGMRAAQRLLSIDQVQRRRRRPWIWGSAAASLALCGSALAAATGAWQPPMGRQLAQTLPVVSPATPGRVRGAAKGAQESFAPVAVPAPIPSAMPELAPPPATSRLAGVEARETGLEEVNRLFAEAKRARRELRDADALALLQKLLAKHGASVLAHEASVERFRALVRLGRDAEAKRAAQAYLNRYPTGFAAAEAHRVVGGGEP